jgi:cyclic-di-GMP phosphodiesterase TipF (flagellum assembly factor)
LKQGRRLAIAERASMGRLVHSFITLCLAIAAASMAVALFVAAEVPAIPAALFGVGLFALAVHARGLAGLKRRLWSFAGETAQNRQAIDALLDRADAIESRLGTLEAAKYAKSADGEVGVEIATLGALVKDLAEAVASQETRLAMVSARGAGTSPPPDPPAPAPPRAPARRPAQPGSPVPASREAPSLWVSDAGRSSSEAEEAIGSGRIEVHLQPIVTLPQRKVRLYEAFVVLKSAAGRIIPASEHAPAAAALGRRAAFDEMAVLRCVQIARKLAARNRDLLLVCNLSPDSLSTPGFVSEVTDLLAASPGLGSQLVFEFSQAEVAAMGSAEFDALRTLGGAGCRFSMDAVTDLRLDGHWLAAHGFRFAKPAAALLLDETSRSTEIHAADLAGLLARYGVELVAESIEAEAMVADLLDYDLRLAQGALFSPPRLVRPEVLTDEPAAKKGPAPSSVPKGASSQARPDRPAATLGQTALHDVIDKLRKVQKNKAGEVAPDQGGARRSAWRILARRIGARERAEV